MKLQLLLLEDVDNLGRSGDVVTAKRGFIRNFLLPKKKAEIANKQTLKKQAALKAEREKRAAVDKKEADALAARFVGFSLRHEAKVDPEGNMYGSVTAQDLVALLAEKGFVIERSNILLQQPIRVLGPHIIQLKLKEGVRCSFEMVIHPEGGEWTPPKKQETVVEQPAEEESSAP